MAVVILFAVIVAASTVGSFATVSADANEGATAVASAIQGRISAGGPTSCAVLDDGAVRCWGDNYSGQLGSTVNNHSNVANPTPQPAVALGRKATAVSVGGVHACALLDNGTVRCWGNNINGQLGSAATSGSSAPNPSPQAAVALGDGRSAAAIAAGSYHTCALLDDGTVRCWGSNAYGQLGATITMGASTPNPQAAVRFGVGRTALAIAAGNYHTCALLDDGTVRCWGSNSYGQLAVATPEETASPQPAVGLGRPARAITAGGFNTCALLDNGVVRCWGRNRYGEIGSTTNLGTLDPTPTPQPAVDLGAAAITVSAGSYHVCARLAGGTVRCWGHGGSGQLGQTGNSTNPSPLDPVDLGPGRRAAAITTGGSHSCAVLDNGTARCWGANGSGQLGSTTNNGTAGPTLDPQPPVAVGSAATATRISAGGDQTCATLSGGLLRCWGINELGQLASPTNNGHDGANPVAEPTIHVGGVPSAEVAIGDDHACAVLTDGAVRCWGSNSLGQLGTHANSGTENPNPFSQTPIDLGPGRRAVDVAANSHHTCALLDNGRVRCWGDNMEGQLGSTANLNALVPNPSPQPAVDLGRKATAITLGYNHACALLDNGSVRCWGANREGQLGSSTNTGTGLPNPAPLGSVDLGAGRRATAISAGAYHTCAVLDDGTVRCWGDNYDGQLGSSTNSGDTAPNPSPLPAVNLGRRATEISAGEYHTCVLLDEGSVRCWGMNSYGQLGSATNNGQNVPNPTPQAAVGLGNGRRATEISAGDHHTCVLLDDSTLRCFGRNAYGQLGSAVNAGENTPNPDPVIALLPVINADIDWDGAPDRVDNCPVAPNPEQTNTDGDTNGDACDTDDDGDAVSDGADNCPLHPNPDQVDTDADGTGDACEPLVVPDPVPDPEPGPGPGPDPDQAEAFISLQPARYADSRNESTFDKTHRNTGPRRAGTTWEIDIAGRGSVPTNATAAVANLTVLNGTGPGFATVHPCGTLPNASSVNYGPGTVEPNEVITKLSARGTMCVYTLTDADVIVDVVGYTTDRSAYRALTPARYADSRDEATFDGSHRNTGIRQGGTTWEIDVAGRGQVPADATSVVANVTVTGGAAPGFATIHPCGTVPNASSLNYGPGVTVPNELVTKLSTAGTMCIYTLSDVHVIVDIVGYLATTPAYHAMTPTRHADSRNENTFDGTHRNTGIREGGTVWEVKVAGRGKVPADATSVVANLTVTGAAAPGFATVYPCGTLPNASSLNYGPGTTRANEVITKLSPAGTICIYTLTPTNVIIDIVGHA